MSKWNYSVLILLFFLSESVCFSQKIDTILRENADCTNPILITDTIVYSPKSPNGFGNELEISRNNPNDPFYFEREHNTVWYKFVAKKSGKLTFDIITRNINDDYDFMLFKYKGDNFCSKVITKEVKPIRTCISRNDKKLKSMTGLTLDDSSKFHVHSGIGSSYVQFIQVEKGEIYYLLIDNVYKNGDGHTIRFHYKAQNPAELYVGKLIPFEEIQFESEDYKFMPGSEKGLDSLYQFLIINPKIKIEIQGHVNTAGANVKPLRYGKQELSDLRAKAIYDNLISKGIDSERLKWVGFSDRFKKIKNPRNKREYFINMRAEIKILSLDYKKN